MSSSEIVDRGQSTGRWIRAGHGDPASSLTPAATLEPNSLTNADWSITTTTPEERPSGRSVLMALMSAR